MYKFLLAISVLLLLFSINSYSQESIYPQNYFSSPVAIPITTSGTFAEIRNNHFHSGLDIRIGGVIGLPVYSPADGEVSRIKIQAFGGGKNLYIRHPNGYTTVYMHLDKYSSEIEKYVRDYQYANKTYEFDIQIPLGRLKVSKGELIALAGNSGSSAGPHLHFEIRNTKTENTINPLLFGLMMQDSIPPKIEKIRIVPYGKYSRVEGESRGKNFDVDSIQRKEGGIIYGDTVFVTNEVSLGILAFDRANASVGHNGLAEIRLYVDDKLFWIANIKEFSFANTRYANAWIDYEEYLLSNNRYLMSRKTPNNNFSAIKTYDNEGVIVLKNNQLRKIRYETYDFERNKDTLEFYLLGVPSSPNGGLNPMKEPIQFFPFDKDNKYIASDSSEFFVPKGALYEDMNFYYTFTSSKYSSVYKLEGAKTPLHTDMILKLRIPAQLLKNKTLLSKATVVKVDGNSLSSIGGRVVDGFIMAKTRTFGNYMVALDTVKPYITQSNFVSGKRIRTSQKTIEVKISDNLSGIASYSGYLNDEWVLFEYDGKRARLIYDIYNQRLKVGRNKLIVKVVDEVGNISQKEFVIIR